MTMQVFTVPEAARETFESARKAAYRDIDLSDRAPEISLVRVPHGTLSGKSAVLIHVWDPASEVRVIAQTTLALLKTAMAAFEGAEARDQGEG